MGVFKDFFGFDVPTRFIIFMWTLGITAMLGLSIHDLCPIFRDYFDVDANVDVMIEKIEKDQTKSPNLYICLPASESDFLNQLIDYEQDNHPHLNFTLNSSCPMCSGLRKNGWDVWSHLHFNGGHENETLKNELHLAFLRKIFKNLPRMDDILSVNNSQWNQPIVESIMKFIRRIQSNDLITMNVGYSENSTSDRNYLDGFIADRSNQEIDTLYDQLLRHKANLQNVIGDDDSNYFAQGISLFPQPGFDNYCFRMNITQGFFLLEAKQDFFKYSINFDSFYIYTQSPLATSGLPTPLYKSNKDEQDIGTAPKQTVKLMYNIQSSVRELRDGKHCYHHQSKVDCIKECQARKIIQLCSCLPFATKRLSEQIDTNNSTYCTISDYEKCTEYDQSMPDKCTEKCTVACEYEFYQWQITTEKSQEDLELRVDVTASVTPYLQFTLDVKDYQANLISQVGGIFNFYLGWSGLSLFACAIFLLECYSRWRECKAAPPVVHENGEVHQQPTTLHMVKMASLTGETVDEVKDRQSESGLHKEVDMLKKLVKELSAKVEEMEMERRRNDGRYS